MLTLRRLPKLVWLLIGLAWILRIAFVSQGGVSFHYDMARDAYLAQQILAGDLKILGPPTSTPGLFHGVLYYYLIAPVYGLGQGDPRPVAIFLSLINSLTIIPIYLLAQGLLKSTNWGLVAAGLYSIAFEASQYGPWLSNPAPAMLTVAVFFYGLYLWLKNHHWGLPLAALAAALSVQFQFFLIYLFLAMVIFKFIFATRVTVKQLLIACGLTMLGLSSMVVATVKFGSTSQLVSGLLSIISSPAQYDYRVTFTDSLLNYLNRLADIFISNFLPISIILGGLLGVVTIIFLVAQWRHQSITASFILFCLFTNVVAFIFGGHQATFISVGMVTPAILAVTLMMAKLWNKSAKFVYLLIGLMVLSNLITIFKLAPRGQLALVIPKDMLLKQQLKLIDQSYQEAEGQPFSINTITLPLWINTTWAYLYNWYGQERYGYLPAFYGRDQIGQPGGEILQKVDQPLAKSFLIIEPGDGIPPNLLQQEIDSENGKTGLVEELSFGSLKLQVRQPREDRSDTAN